MGTLTRLGGLERTERSSTDGRQDFHRWGPGQDTISCPLPVFSLICVNLCHLWIKTPSPDRKRTGPGLAAKRRKRRKKDGAAWERTPPPKQEPTQLGLFIFTPCAPYGVPCFCSVVRTGRSGGDGPIRPTLQKTTNATMRARSLDNDMEDRKIPSVEQARPRFLSQYFCRKSSSPLPNPGPNRPIRTTLQKPGCSSVAWAVSAHPPPPLFESARLRSHPLLITPPRSVTPRNHFVTCRVASSLAKPSWRSAS